MRKSCAAFVAIASLLAVGLTLLVGPDTASAGQCLPKPGKSAGPDVIEIKVRGRTRPIYPPISPSYLAYDYPYYYNRGYYPTRIGGPGYVYYDYPHSFGVSPRFGGECAYWPSKSVRRAWINAQKCVGR